ncbi:HypC/HybG/HupF family hydrogenase formation chaperone [Candidatus Woesearchaeota archaeon]|nr:MAG: HypC/HybG/HupF family hydrogenase formation chaperone [Candidatus Woesearchaeota archaeon]
MCLMVPGKIIAIKGDKATVDYDVEKRTATLVEKKFKIGDYVLVQGGFVIQKVSDVEAKESLELYKKAVA